MLMVCQPVKGYFIPEGYLGFFAQGPIEYK